MLRIGIGGCLGWFDCEFVHVLIGDGWVGGLFYGFCSGLWVWPGYGLCFAGWSFFLAVEAVRLGSAGLFLAVYLGAVGLSDCLCLGC